MAMILTEVEKKKSRNEKCKPQKLLQLSLNEGVLSTLMMVSVKTKS
jgi:hypothetical protein